MTTTHSEAVDFGATAKWLAELERPVAQQHPDGQLNVRWVDSQNEAGTYVLEILGSFAQINDAEAEWDAAFAATTEEQENFLQQMEADAWAAVDAGNAQTLEDFLGLDEQ